MFVILKKYMALLLFLDFINLKVLLILNNFKKYKKGIVKLKYKLNKNSSFFDELKLKLVLFNFILNALKNTI
ncbi:hypothetical protein BpHYR1_013402 [Brachionus plicatilis]|uniref:Uncharacterized protein n=1 Tax=Brachionus plicatilis TaxID=10195 RepID=A0A3M7RHG9_BRAPC|nr:hypothetical protein BpHYR1_013402 [Brachionus plicatilis]